MNGQRWIGLIIDRLNDNTVRYRSRPTDYNTAQFRAEERAKRLKCGDRFAVIVLDRYAKWGMR